MTNVVNSCSCHSVTALDILIQPPPPQKKTNQNKKNWVRTVSSQSSANRRRGDRECVVCPRWWWIRPGTVIPGGVKGWEWGGDFTAALSCCFRQKGLKLSALCFHLRKCLCCHCCHSALKELSCCPPHPSLPPRSHSAACVGIDMCRARACLHTS